MDEPNIYQVYVSPRARDMLFEHLGFLAQVNLSAADNLLDEFEEKVISLETFPERCAYYNNPYLKTRKYRKLSLGKYLQILFQIEKNKVHIELIIDTRAENMTL